MNAIKCITAGICASCCYVAAVVVSYRVGLERGRSETLEMVTNDLNEMSERIIRQRDGMQDSEE